MRKLRFAIFLSIVSVLFAVQPSLFAANYDIKEMTPEIQKAFEGRKARYETLQGLKAEGVIGEDREGFIKTLRDGVSSGIVQEENRDREVIYRAIVEQNGLGRTGMAEVKRAFAEVQREKTRTGDFFQLPSGDWAKK